MPRDGSNQYHRPPGTDAITNTTIASAPYNSYVADVEQDLNLPRPIVAGGTSASSATQALFNLSGETATQNVTNWDSQLWLPGSFYAATSAAGTAPVAGHAFAGVCYLNEPLANPPTNKNLVVEATDLTDSANTKYIRVMTAGVWSAWVRTGATSAAGTLGEYTFDTGTGFPPASGTVRFNNATQNSTTELFISHLTANGVDVTGSIPLFKAGNDIAIQDKNTSTSYKIFTATAGPVISGGDCRILVTAKITGLDLANTARLLVNVPGGPAVRYDAPQGLTTNQQAQARANINVTKKNYIINGAMMISQENGATAGTTIGYYPVDMFRLSLSNAGTQTIQQVASATAGGSPNRIRVTATAADASVAAGDYCRVIYVGEGLRSTDLKFGSAAAKTITIQFGVKAPAGTYCVSLNNAAGDRSYVAEYAISAGEANTDVVKSVTIQCDTTGTWAQDNTVGLIVQWLLMCGSTFQQAAGSWGTVPFAMASANQFNFMGTGGNVFELFDVSLTEGTVAPPFQVPDYASELALCQRYYEKSYAYAVKPGTNTGNGGGSVSGFGSAVASGEIGAMAVYKAIKRVNPTVLFYDNAGTVSTMSALNSSSAWVHGLAITLATTHEYSVAAAMPGSGLYQCNFDYTANARL